MTPELRISCINKTDKMGAHERIRSIGGRDASGNPWKHLQEVAIRNIKTKVCNYYVEQPAGHRVKVIVAKSAAGNEYLKTEKDGEQPNNLLSLPECR